MSRLFLCGAMLALGFMAGAYVSSTTAASLMPARNGGECIAVDQDRNGQEVGRWQPNANGRCLLRDFRRWHPFGG